VALGTDDSRVKLRQARDRWLAWCNLQCAAAGLSSIRRASRRLYVWFFQLIVLSSAASVHSGRDSGLALSLMWRIKGPVIFMAHLLQMRREIAWKQRLELMIASTKAMSHERAFYCRATGIEQQAAGRCSFADLLGIRGSDAKQRRSNAKPLVNVSVDSTGRLGSTMRRRNVSWREIREPIPSEIMRRAENVSTLRGPVVSIAKRTGLGPVCRGLFSCVANGAQLVALCSFLHPEVIVNIDSDRGSPDSRFMQNWRQYCVAAELRPRTQHIDCGRHCTSNSRRPLTPLQSTIRITLGEGFRPRRNRQRSRQRLRGKEIWSMTAEKESL